MASPLRALPALLPLLALFTQPVLAQAPQSSPPQASAQPAQLPPLRPAAQGPDTPWLFKGSDIPPDRAWTFGVLPNGLRYAVRRNGVPPGQVAIRVAMDAGSLMETERERGYAHFLEHLSFRGSVHVPDGESKRVWQRLGVTFGSDSNASTTPTQTVYKLDLPSATPAGLNESMKILAGMMAQPTLNAQSITAERPVVLSEQREQPGPQLRLGDATRALFFHGQPLADRSPIGSIETLEAATPASVQAFHDRWYRPDRATVIVVGDLDPAVLEAAVKTHFSAWKASGPAPAEPKFGKPVAGGPRSAATSEGALQPLVQMAVLRPWTIGNDTIRFNQDRMIDQVAIRLINRRLESRARAGGSFIAAGADLDDVSRSANITSVTVLPLGDDWEAALKDVRSVIEDAIRRPPTQGEIDREVAEIRAAMQNAVATAPVEAGAAIADNLAHAVDIRETVAGSPVSLQIFEGAASGGFFTPAKVQAATRKVFTGTVTRALVNTRTPQTNAPTRLAAALSAKVGPGTNRTARRGAASFDALPALGTPASVSSRVTVLPEPQIDQVNLSNGTKLLMSANAAETGKVYVRVAFGRGRNALPADRLTPAFAGELALVASGIQGRKGLIGQEELDELTGARQIGLGFSIGDDAFVLSGTTTRADLTDQLRLIAAKLSSPGWDPQPVARARALMLAGVEGQSASPDAVLGRDLDELLHAGDARWRTPGRAEIEALDAKAFRAYWEPLLATGPIEVSVFGDIDPAQALEAVQATIGALPPRAAASAPLPPVRFPAHVATPVVRTHEGQPNQAAAVLAWPTGGGSAGITESRKLELLASVFRDRLLDRLRSEAGVSYSPNVANGWPVGLPGGGRIMALGLVPPDRTDYFFELVRGIAADLVAKPVSADELARSAGPLLQRLARISSGNMFWLQLSAGGTTDPQRLAAIPSIARDIGATTPGELQALAAKYLQPSKDWSMVVLPEKK